MEPRHRFIYAFDFDGTLTSRDSLLAIIRYAKGPLFFCLVMLRFAPLLVLMKLGRYSNSLLKQKLLARCFGGMPIGEFNKMCRTFAAAHTPILYIEGVRYLKERLQELSFSPLREEGVYIVSASPSNWVRPFFDQLELTDEERSHLFFLCTEAEVVDGCFTGRFSTPNCYGLEKVNRLKESLVIQRSFYHITAFGDSRGDRELFEFADEHHFKPFTPQTPCLPDSLSPCLPVSLNTPFLRFALVGTTAVVIQYGVYLLLLSWLLPVVANTIGYLISFLFNYIASVRYTFRVKSSARRGLGFAFSHLVNYLLQTGFLALFLWLGLAKAWAMIPVFAICVPVNFILVRFFLTKDSK